jgi:hypothetical protein
MRPLFNRCLVLLLPCLLAACATTAPHGGRSASNPRIVERDLGGDALTSADERKPAAAR